MCFEKKRTIQRTLSHKSLLLCGIICIGLFAQIQGVTCKSNPHSASSDPLYYDVMDAAFQLTAEEEALLFQNQFIVLNRLGTDDILDAFEYYWMKDLPIFISTDMMLHIWHLLFSETLKKTEQTLLYPLLRNLTIAMTRTYLQEVDLENLDLVNRDLLLFFAVAACLANGKAFLPLFPPDLAADLEAILDMIESEVSFGACYLTWDGTSLSRFIDDYSQYKPRGHYTETTALQAYFHLFKWLARLPFCFESFCGQSALGRTTEDLITSTIHLVWTLKHTSLQIGNATFSGLEIFSHIDQFITFLVGNAYSITPKDIDLVCSSMLNTPMWHFNDFSSVQILQIQDLVVSNSEIPRSNYYPLISHYLIECFPPPPESPKTFYFLGERFTLDAQELEIYAVEILGACPTGLDFAARCLFSGRARELLGSVAVGEILNARERLANASATDRNPINWRWIETLQELVKSTPNINDPDTNASFSLPSFLQSGPWRDEKLTTVMGSWAQLKHDTILYSRQATGWRICSTPEGYVEPYPAFYQKLTLLVGYFNVTMSNLYAYHPSLVSFVNNTCAYFQNVSTQLESIAMKELHQIELSPSERTFLQGCYSHIASGCTEVMSGWLPSLLGLINITFINWGNPSWGIDSRVSLIADVFTEPNDGIVLEVATGVFEHLLVIVPGWNQTDIVAVGPVFSYYEFRSALPHRMTDNEWRGVLFTHPDNSSEWDDNAIQRGPWAETYMMSTEKTVSYLHQDIPSNYNFSVPSWVLASHGTVFTPSYMYYQWVEYGDYQQDLPPFTVWPSVGEFAALFFPPGTTTTPTPTTSSPTIGISPFISIAMVTIGVVFVTYLRKKRITSISVR